MIGVAKLSTRGQVAIPKSIREKLKLKEGDTLLFEEERGEVRLKRIRSFLDLEGSLPPLKLTTEETREKALEEMAKEVANV
jgi:AbrB family looped-hinge helix DNA binding protein